MVKIIKLLVVLVALLGSLFVALIFFVGITGGFSRYSPHRMLPYPAEQEFEHDGDVSPGVQESQVEPDQNTQSSDLDSRNS